jgi:Fe-S-cluster containining protein
MAATATDQHGAMDCRPDCGACCIAPSIASPLPGMPGGKPAGVPCAHLTPELRCELFGRPERPAFCGGLQPSREMCGEGRNHALAWLAAMEQATKP